MKLIIVRHADPDYSIDSLTKKGFKEAELLASGIIKINADYIYCSPLGRARDTIKPSLDILKKDPTILPWLREFEGKVRIGAKIVSCWDRMPSDWCADKRYYDADEWFNTDLMKSVNTKKEYKYVCTELDRLLIKHGYEHKGRTFKVNNSNHDTIILVCHFGVESVILSHIFSVSPMIFWHNFVALPTSVTTLITEEREEGIATFRTQQFGDISHLYKDDEEAAFAARFCECFNDDTRH